MNLEINKRVVYYRRQKGYTQADVAERIGMKSSTYSQMERVGNISAERIIKLANVFGVKPDDILFGTPDDGSKPDGNNVVPGGQPPVPIPEPQPFVLTNKEQSIISIFRILKQKDKRDVINYIESKRKKAGISRG